MHVVGERNRKKNLKTNNIVKKKKGKISNQENKYVLVTIKN